MLLLKKMQVLCLALIGFFSLSCSIDYGRMKETGEKRPNIVFKNIKVDRYESSSASLLLSCERLEMYSKDKLWVGKNLKFKQLEKDTGDDEFRGVAGLSLIDEQKNEYFLGENVKFESIKDKLTIEAPSLYWIKDEHILSSSEKDVISIEKQDEMSIKGSGFIANTASKEFELKNQIEGVIYPKKDDGDQSGE